MRGSVRRRPIPCNTIITNTVELKNVKNQDILLRALADLGGVKTARGARFFVNGTAVDLVDGLATSSMRSDQLGAVLDLVKQAYSREAIKFAAKRFGWTVQKGADLNNFHILKG